LADAVAERNDKENKPGDLIGYDDAAFIANRSKVTIRRWLRDGFMEKYAGKASRGRSPPTLLRRSELEEYLISIDEIPRELPNDDIDMQVEDASNEVREAIERLRSREVPTIGSIRKITQLERAKIAISSAKEKLSRAALQAKLEMAEMREEMAVLKGRISTLQAELNAARSRATRAEVELEGTRQEIKHWQEKVEAERSVISELQKMQRVSWWRKLLS
jgi:chromosome segregation ATPase